MATLTQFGAPRSRGAPMLPPSRKSLREAAEEACGGNGFIRGKLLPRRAGLETPEDPQLVDDLLSQLFRQGLSRGHAVIHFALVIYQKSSPSLAACASPTHFDAWPSAQSVEGGTGSCVRKSIHSSALERNRRVTSCRISRIVTPRPSSASTRYASRRLRATVLRVLRHL